MGLQFLFMDDNAPCHHTVAAEQLLESEDIERMDWPARSPDLNLIEHVWDFLGRRLAARTLPPAVGSPVVRASDSRPEGLVHLQKFGGGDRIYRPFGKVSLSLNRTVTCMVLKAPYRHCPCHDEFRGPRSDYFTCRNCGDGDRGRVAIYRPFGELCRAKIVLSPVWCSRPTTDVPLAHATMNFVGLDL
ncbi:transposable element Tc3 transposase [Trichonephila clavipes]|nr:transposable element Tc3 transposase [Trichonephila clavipes]